MALFASRFIDAFLRLKHWLNNYMWDDLDFGKLYYSIYFNILKYP